MLDQPRLTRRDLLFGRLVRGAARMRDEGTPGRRDTVGGRAALIHESGLGTPGSKTSLPQTAIIQGRQCLAYRNLVCSSCVERCPEPEAIRVRDGVPQVVSEHCTGCGDCQAVCPAPVNAVLLIPKRGG